MLYSTQVLVLVLGIGIARGQYYWVLDIGCLSWYRSNPNILSKVMPFCACKFPTHIPVIHTQETCIRNWHRIERSSIRCKFLVSETFKHSRPIKPHNFCHAHWRTFRAQISGTSFVSVCNTNRYKSEVIVCKSISFFQKCDCWCPTREGVTLNNPSDYRTNGLHRTPNPNPSPLARYSTGYSPIVVR